MKRWAATALASAIAVTAPGCSGGGDPVFVGAGDIASGTPADSATAALLAAIPGTVFALGDDAYENGSPSDYASFYTPTWGQFKSRTVPVHCSSLASAALQLGRRTWRLRCSGALLG
jgi:hypothetical protein